MSYACGLLITLGLTLKFWLKCIIKHGKQSTKKPKQTLTHPFVIIPFSYVKVKKYVQEVYCSMRTNCLVSTRSGSAMQHQASYRKPCVVYLEELFVHLCQAEIKSRFVTLSDLTSVTTPESLTVSNIWVIHCELFSLSFCIVMLLILN